ncbi:hypothetical protein GW17_00028751 [Ensete ventricosum]|nr:hypothetical protein GW17_00028751 [Ensete ventricosum]
MQHGLIFVALKNLKSMHIKNLMLLFFFYRNLEVLLHCLMKHGLETEIAEVIRKSNYVPAETSL